MPKFTILLILSLFKTSYGCFEDLNFPKNEFSQLSEQCLKEKGLNSSKYPKNNSEDIFWYNEKFDNTCLNYCMLDHGDLILFDGTLNKEAAISYVRNHGGENELFSIFEDCYQEVYPFDKVCWTPRSENKMFLQGQKDIFKNASILDIIDELKSQIPSNVMHIQAVKILSENVLELETYQLDSNVYHHIQSQNGQFQSQSQSQGQFIKYHQNHISNKIKSKYLHNMTFRNIPVKFIKGCEFYSTIVLSNLPRNQSGLGELLENSLLKYGEFTSFIEERMYKNVLTHQKIFWFHEKTKIPANLTIQGMPEIKLEILQKPKLESNEMNRCSDVSKFVRCFNKKGREANICGVENEVEVN